MRWCVLLNIGIGDHVCEANSTHLLLRNYSGFNLDAKGTRMRHPLLNNVDTIMNARKQPCETAHRQERRELIQSRYLCPAMLGDRQR